MFFKSCLSLVEQRLAAIAYTIEGGDQFTSLERHVELQICHVIAEIFARGWVASLRCAELQGDLLP